MKITIEQAAQWFENRAKDTPMPATKEMFQKAAEALWERAERENPAPLTLEELLNASEPVWIQDKLGPDNWAEITGHDSEWVHIAACGDYVQRMPKFAYGDGWIAYRHKPKGD